MGMLGFKVSVGVRVLVIVERALGEYLFVSTDLHFLRGVHVARKHCHKERLPNERTRYVTAARNLKPKRYGHFRLIA